MEEQLTRLIDQAWDRYRQLPPDRRLLIAIGGIPGSGKTTLATSLVTALNARAAKEATSTSPPAAYIPMDGYHLTRDQLSAMPDPATAHARRGAEFTFDAAAYLSLVKELRLPISQAPNHISAPSFDHAIKDPVNDAIPVLPDHRVVVVEGLYVMLDKEPWKEAAGLMDERWFVEVDFEVARRRLARRHVAAGIVDSLEAGDRRARENDLVNGRQIVEERLPVDEVVVSHEDGGWAH